MIGSCSNASPDPRPRFAEYLWSAEQVTGVVTMSPKVAIEPAGFP